MTEKRFEFREATLTGMKLPYVYDKSMQEYLNPLMCVDLLNDLYEERNYFERKKCEYWNKFNLAHLDNIKLRKENEQLKEKNEELLAKLKYTCEKINYSEKLMEMMK